MDLETKVASLLKTGPKSNKEMRAELGLTPDRYDSHLDRALQKLRKAGKLKLIGGRWVVSSVEVCDSCSGKGWVHA